MVEKNHVYLVDGSGFIFRAYHALPPLTRPDGTPVNAVLGFVNMLIKLTTDLEATHLAVIFDAARRNFRHDIFPAYKANRQETPPELIPQFGLIREACEAFQVCSVELEGFEADDLIASYTLAAQKEGMQVTVVSSDKDLMQLLAHGASIFDPMKNKSITVETCMEKFGVPPHLVKDVQAMAGDSSDNIPGIPGIGVKTAAELIGIYGSLEGVLIHAGEVKQPKRRQLLLDHADSARISYELVALKGDVPLAVGFSDMKIGEISYEPIQAFLKTQNFHSVLSRLQKKMPVVTQEAKQLSLLPDTEERKESRHVEDISFEAGLVTWMNNFACPTGKIFLAMDISGSGSQIVLHGLVIAAGGQFACLKLDQLPLKSVAAILSNEHILKVGHNIKPFVEWALKQGHQVKPIDDVMVISYVLANGRHKHDFSSLSQVYAGTPFDANLESLRKNDPEKLVQTLVEQCEVLAKVEHELRKELIQQRLLALYESLEKPLIFILAAMEQQGVLVDVGILERLSHDFSKEISLIEQEVFKIAGREFNIGSPKQLGEVLFDELKLSQGKKAAKSSGYVTNIDVLEELSSSGHAIADHLIQWRQLTKLKNTYTDALVQQIDPVTGRVHTNYAMATTATGRLSSIDPNLQNIPVRTMEGKKIREAFVAPPGKLLVSFDYSQIELRLLAHVADIEALKMAFHEDKDIHAMTASQVFDVPLDLMTPELRRRAKAINFGIIYGISAFGLGRQIHESSKTAGEYIKRYFEQYPGIRKYMIETIEYAKTHGYVLTPWGRRCHILGLGDLNFTRRQFAERQAINAPLQGGAADIIKKAMVKIGQSQLPSASMILQVHDELVFEVDQEKAEELVNIIKPIMENVVSLSVPLKVDTTSGVAWS
ncbi:MAG: DNA polymerase I [Alphaproteobacteria bacterium]|nr:DNA polymerase I [Alphaproteobacteria bacterium]OJV47552.1 MAG: DNA polymerase I [Alphaproteobacteria bacterium 43-37]